MYQISNDSIKNASVLDSSVRTPRRTGVSWKCRPLEASEMCCVEVLSRFSSQLQRIQDERRWDRWNMPWMPFYSCLAYVQVYGAPTVLYVTSVNTNCWYTARCAPNTRIDVWNLPYRRKTADVLRIGRYRMKIFAPYGHTGFFTVRFGCFSQKMSRFVPYGNLPNRELPNRHRFSSLPQFAPVSHHWFNHSGVRVIFFPISCYCYCQFILSIQPANSSGQLRRRRVYLVAIDFIQGIMIILTLTLSNITHLWLFDNIWRHE